MLSVFSPISYSCYIHVHTCKSPCIPPLPAVGGVRYTDGDGARLLERDWLGSVMELDNGPSTVSRAVGAGDLLSIGLSKPVAME